MENGNQLVGTSYLDFDLEINPGTGREYPISVIRSPAGEARATMLFPFDTLALESKLDKLQIALLRSGGARRQALTPDEQAVQDFGTQLFDALIVGEVRSRYDVSQLQAAREGKGLRLRLRISSPELATLPWEFLYDSRHAEYLCLSTKTPVVRYFELPQVIQPLLIEPPLRVLGMTVSPTDLPKLDVEREKQRVENAVKELKAEGKVHLTWLPGQTWRDLQRAMRTGMWHIFHFIGHGGFDRQADEGMLAFADEEGKSALLTATQLGRLLADHASLRLALLNSCEGARGGDQDLFSSTASILVRRGIPAVLAMQYEISDRAAIGFARAFYEAIADGYPVDAAMAESRKAVTLEVTNTIEWGTPVLFMRAPDGILFHLGTRPAVIQPGHIQDIQAQPSHTRDVKEQNGRMPKEQTQDAPQKSKRKKTTGAKTRQPQSAPTTPSSKRATPKKSKAELPTKSPASKQVPPRLTPLKTAVELALEKTASEDSPRFKLLAVLKGHNKQINSVVFSPDGQKLISGAGGDFGMGLGPLRVWQVPDGKMIQVLEGHLDGVRSVACSGDGHVLASGAQDGTVKLWQMPEGKLFQTLAGHRNWVSSVAFAPDGRLLASASIDNVIRLWQVPQGKLFQALTGHNAFVHSVAFAPNGRLLASASSDRTIKLWQMPSGKLVQTLTGHNGEVYGVEFSANGLLLASASGDKTIGLWKLPEGKLIRILDGHSQPVKCVAFSSDSQLMASASWDGKMILWRIPDGKLLQTLEGHTGYVRCVAFSRDGRLLASGGDDQIIRIWQRQ